MKKRILLLAAMFLLAASSLFGQSATKDFTINVLPAAGGGTGGNPQIPAAAPAWFSIPNSSIQSLCPPYAEIQATEGCKAVMADWSGAWLDTKRNHFVIHGGGHTGYYGNEVYSINLTVNPMVKSLLRDATHGASLTAPAACGDTNADGNPNSVHNYSGMAYLAVTDKYIRQGGSKANCGSFTDATWLYNPNTNTFAASSHNNHEGSSGSPGAIAYDPTTQKVYEGVHNTGDFVTYDPVTDLWSTLGTFTLPCNVGTSHTSAIDEGRRLYFCIGAGAFDKVSLVSPFTVTHMSGTATGCSAIINDSAPGFAYYQPRREMVGWAGGNTVYHYNPDTNTCTPQTVTGGPTVNQGNGTYGRWQYDPYSGVFLYASDIFTNLIALRLDSADTVANLDLQARCALAAAIVCRGFDSDPEYVIVSGTHDVGNHVSADTGNFWHRDTTTYASGGSSAKVTVPAKSGSNTGGEFWQPFCGVAAGGSCPVGSTTHFGNGTTMWFSYMLKIEQGVLNQHPKDGSGTATYFKQHIVADADNGSCTLTQHVIVNLFDDGHHVGYSACGADPFQVSSASGLLDQQGENNVDLGQAQNTGYNCIHNTTANCLLYADIAGIWVNYTCMVQIGTLGTATSNIKCWAQLPGDEQREFINIKNHTLQASAPDPFFSEIFLTHYYTNRDPNTTFGNDSFVHYDELIVAANPIPPRRAPVF